MCEGASVCVRICVCVSQSGIHMSNPFANKCWRKCECLAGWLVGWLVSGSVASLA